MNKILPHKAVNSIRKYKAFYVRLREHKIYGQWEISLGPKPENFGRTADALYVVTYVCDDNEILLVYDKLANMWFGFDHREEALAVVLHPALPRDITWVDYETLGYIRIYGYAGWIQRRLVGVVNGT